MKYVIILERVGGNEEPVYFCGVGHFKNINKTTKISNAADYPTKEYAEEAVEFFSIATQYPNAIIEEIPEVTTIDKADEELDYIELFEARGTESARKIEVIETTALKGNGEIDNPIRLVTQYWSLDGKLLATVES